MKGPFMPIATVNNIKLHFEEYGSGPPVVLVMGSGAGGRAWTPHQVPALTAAGYRVVTIDNRGIPPTDAGQEGFTLDDMVGDIVGLIEFLGISPCRIVGFSLGGVMVQELLLAHPELASQAVLIATRGRTDAMRAAMSVGWAELLERDVALPPRYAAAVHAMQYLSPRTQNDERRIRDWLDIFEMAPLDPSVRQTQQKLDLIGNRLEEYRKIRCHCLIVGFQDDLVVPAFFGRELAGYIPDCRYEEVAECGHYGYLERPDVINSLIVNFFREAEEHQAGASVNP